MPTKQYNQPQISSTQHLYFTVILSLILISTKMYLKRNRQQLKAKIYSKLGLTQQDSEGQAQPYSDLSPVHSALNRALRQTQKKKLGIRKLITENNAHADYSDEIAQLRWRIDALRSFGSREKTGLPDLRSNSLTGKEQKKGERTQSFAELYEAQKKKFIALKERRRNKTTDPRYLQMVGNLQARREKRRVNERDRHDQQEKLLTSHIDTSLTKD